MKKYLLYPVLLGVFALSLYAYGLEAADKPQDKAKCECKAKECKCCPACPCKHKK